MHRLTADLRWPTYRPPTNWSGPIEDGYAGISCFVSVPAIDALGAFFPAGMRPPTRGRDPEDIDREIVRVLYGQVLSRRIPYALEPWNPEEGQVVRDPWWVVGRGGAGTCLDVALLFAGLCLRAHLATQVLVQRTGAAAGPGAVGHVAVAIQLGADPREERVPLGCERAGHGVLFVDDPQSLTDDENVLVVDVTRATASYQESFDEALAAGQGLLRQKRVNHLVNVGLRQASGDEPLPAPQRRAVLSAALPRLGDLQPVPTQERLLDGLREAYGVVVIRGESGTGKTTLALLAAALHGQGKGWYLPATDAAALTAGLANCELAESHRDLSHLERKDIEAFADAALARLRQADGPWVAVLDNANERGPRACEPVLRLASPQNLVIVTSTAPASVWAQAGYPNVIEVPALPPQEVDALLPDPRLTHAAAGTLVLVDAFRRLHGSGRRPEPCEPVTGAEAHPLVDAPAGAGIYVRMLAKAVADDTTATALLDMLGWLPPDHVEVDALAGMLQADLAPAVAALQGCGLLHRPTPDVLSVHRLLGGALRERLTAEQAGQAVARLYAAPAVRRSLLQFGDGEVAAHAEAVLRSCSAPGTGIALATVADMQEVHDAGRSRENWSLAFDLLSPDVPQERAVMADCLHDRAREVNQLREASAEQIAPARAWVARAIALRDADDQVGRAKHEALDALLRQHAARNLPAGSPERIAEYEDVLRELELSYARRRGVLGEEHPLVDRAHYNLAGVRLALAQQDPARASGLLREAEEVYRATLEFRRSFYNGRVTPHTASCLAGLAMCAYYSAVLGDRALAPGRLTAASRYAQEALAERVTVADGQQTGDVVKAARLLAKVYAAWAEASSVGPVWPGLSTEIPRELDWSISRRE